MTITIAGQAAAYDPFDPDPAIVAGHIARQYQEQAGLEGDELEEVYISALRTAVRVLPVAEGHVDKTTNRTEGAGVEGGLALESAMQVVEHNRSGSSLSVTSAPTSLTARDLRDFLFSHGVSAADNVFFDDDGINHILRVDPVESVVIGRDYAGNYDVRDGFGLAPETDPDNVLFPEHHSVSSLRSGLYLAVVEEL